jgi:biofilm PGA synthesis N-glycosyltransferase PgaC
MTEIAAQTSPLNDDGIASALSYVLITPARNEAQFIELTLNSVVAQTIKPLKWVIVSDGSTDGTDEIVSKYTAAYEWIELLRMPERKERNFGGKASAFNAGYKTIKCLPYDVIGSIDADISFSENLFSFLLSKLALNPRLGVTGAPFYEQGKAYDFRFSSLEHVSGACQLFRRKCFEEIGGYVPIRGGGIDVIAVLSARMNGWQTRTYTEQRYEHHRLMGTAKHGLIAKKFKDGEKDYYLGSHPAWELVRSVYQMRGEPPIVGGCALLAGYLWSCLRRMERPISRELIQFRRRGQMERLRRFFADH